MKLNSEHNIILFDGICNLCNSVVQFIIKHDKKNKFVFASLQSDVAKQLLSEINLKPSLETIIMLRGKTYFDKSDAVFEIIKHLSGVWKLMYVFRIVPRFIRNAIYRWIANNRYKLFGKRKSCYLPTPELRAKFL